MLKKNIAKLYKPCYNHYVSELVGGISSDYLLQFTFAP